MHCCTAPAWPVGNERRSEAPPMDGALDGLDGAQSQGHAAVAWLPPNRTHWDAFLERRPQRTASRSPAAFPLPCRPSTRWSRSIPRSCSIRTGRMRDGPMLSSVRAAASRYKSLRVFRRCLPSRSEASLRYKLPPQSGVANRFSCSHTSSKSSKTVRHPPPSGVRAIGSPSMRKNARRSLERFSRRF